MLEKIKSKLKWLDPFTYVDAFVIPKVDSLEEKHQWLIFAASFLLLSFFVSVLFGATPTILILVFLFYAYLFFFEKKEAVHWGLYILFAFVFAFVLYYFVLSFLLGTEAPLMIVFSGSMEPVFYRGDVVILTGASELVLKEAVVDFPVKNKRLLEFAEVGYRLNSRGELRQASVKINEEEFEFDPQGPIIVYPSDFQKKDIIHRAVLKISAPDGDYLITFGDNNPVIDQFCSENPSLNDCINPSAIPVEKVKGKYLFHIPFIGQVKLLFFDDIPRLLFN